MASFADIRTSTPTPGHGCDGASFGQESSVHSGLGGEELSYVPANESAEDELSIALGQTLSRYVLEIYT